MIQYICSGGFVTILSSEGKPTQVPASSLNMLGGFGTPDVTAAGNYDNILI